VKILGNIDSKSLGRSVPYYILLPTDFKSDQLRYPVLFLLHGLFGAFTNWIELTDIETRAHDHPLIIVMPEGADGWYTDSETNKYESFFLSELLPHIDNTYRTLPARSSRAVAGLSMGGYGAFKFALKRPDLFRLAASFSGAFDAPQRTDETPGHDWETLRPSILKAFGSEESETRRHNDLWSILQSGTPASLPFFYFDCGTQDGFLQANKNLCTAFCEHGVSHEFREIEGGHDWEYWNSRVADLLQLVSSNLSKPR
jgi:S-formylglutathione hydrolase FrmB